MPATAQAQLIFDGECQFCTACADWVVRHGHNRVAAIAWQELGDAGLGQLGLRVVEAQRAAWWVDPSGRLYGGHKAAAQALCNAGGWKRLIGRMMLLPPLSWIAAAGYRLVVRYRGRLPGRRTACGTGTTTPGGPQER